MSGKIKMAKADKPYLVELYQEANGDLNAMKDLMAEKCGQFDRITNNSNSPDCDGAQRHLNRGAPTKCCQAGAGSS